MPLMEGQSTRARNYREKKKFSRDPLPTNLPPTYGMRVTAYQRHAERQRESMCYTL